MGRLIRTFLVNDQTDGLKTLEISNMTIKATVFPRPFLKEFLARDEAGRPGVYMLYGSEIDSSESPMLYIGEGDPVSERLKSHGVKKDFWTEAFVFTSKDDYLSKTQIKYLESKLIDLAKETKRVNLDNVNASSVPTISEVDEAEVQQFLDAIQLLVRVLNLPFFDPLSYRSRPPKDDEIIYEYRVKGHLGRMAIRDGKYVLLAGSTAAKEFRTSASQNIKRYRMSLEEDGAITAGEQEGELIVVRDIPCDSPSRAAVIICGGSAAGPIKWKYNGKTLKDLEQMQP